MKKIAVLISGGGTNLQALIDGVNQGHIDGKIEIVISNVSNAYGLVRAQKSGIATRFLSKKQLGGEAAYNTALRQELQTRGIDLVVLAGYLRILEKDFIAAFKHRIINIHPSLIPAFCGKNYYGMAVHQSVYDKGVKYTGATTHFVDDGVDTGAIILQAITLIEAADNPQTIADKVLKLEHRLLLDSVALFCQNRLTIDAHNKVVIKEKQGEHQ